MKEEKEIKSVFQYEEMPKDVEETLNAMYQEKLNKELKGGESNEN